MAEFNLFKELKTGVSEEIKKSIDEVANDQSLNSSAKQILALCEIFKGKINIFIEKKNSYSFEKATSLTDQEEEDLFVYGAKLIYLLRQFLNEDEILFHFGVIDSNRQLQSEAYIDQKKVVENFSRTRDGAIGITNALQKQLIREATKDKKSSKQFFNNWRDRVELLANVHADDREKNIKTNFSTEDSKGREVPIYQKYTNDKKVYYAYKGIKGAENPAIRAKYYELNNALYYFNNGWLWEWYDTIYNTDKQKRALINKGLKSNTLEPFFDGTLGLNLDNVKGTAEGDYFNKRFKKQIQNKYDNQKIISYNNILKLIDQLSKCLKDFILESDKEEVKKNLLLVLQDNFIPAATRIGQESVNSALNEKLLNKLNQNNLTYYIT